MNKKQLLTASSALLATTALSGVAFAGTAGSFTANGTTVSSDGDNGVTATTGLWTKTIKIANTLFSTTAVTANGVSIGPYTWGVNFANSFTGSTKFSVTLNFSGAQIVTGTVGKAKVIERQGTASAQTFGSTVAVASCQDYTPLIGSLTLDGCQTIPGANLSSGTHNTSGGHVGATVGGVAFSSVSLNSASGLATVGGTVTVSGSVWNYNNVNQIYETIPTATLITSAAAVSATITAGNAVVASPTATPLAFEYLNAVQTAGTNVTGILSMTLATVNITATGAFDNTLTLPVTVNNQSISMGVTVASSILSSAAVIGTTVSNNLFTISNSTPANFAGGAATFSVNSGGGYDCLFAINIAFNGTTVIPKTAAGTVTLVFGPENNAQAVPTATGATATISQGGFNAEIETFLASTNTTFNSYIRIHNNGATTGSVTITVKNDATGAQLGTSFASAAIASGQTLQLSAAQIETSAGFTAVAGVNYTLDVTGPIIGYVQHILFNPATGQVSDLSAFRNGGQDASAP